jgi:SpoVK/Ycf46/Vps4 family AAA+-type ATPase
MNAVLESDVDTVGEGKLRDDIDRIRRLLGASQQSVSPPDPESTAGTLAAAFNLTPFERDVLVLAAAAELEPDISAQCASMNGRGSSGLPTVAMALKFLPEAHWSAFSPSGPLRHWQLIRLNEATALINSGLRLDERVLHVLIGANGIDRRLEPKVRIQEASNYISSIHRALAERLAQNYSGRETWPIIQLAGDDRDGQLDVAAAVAAALGLELLVVRAEDLPDNATDRLEMATLLARESILRSAVLLIDSTLDQSRRLAAEFVESLRGPVMVAISQELELRRASRTHQVNRPESVERLRLWRSALDGQAPPLASSLEVVAAQYRLSAREIHATAVAVLEADSEEADHTLRAMCRTHAHASMDELAQRIQTTAGWDELVLPSQHAESLREIAAQVRNRAKVYDEWGFSSTGNRGLGITALFAGDSGTGKTMAAEVLANEIGLDLYRIDLSTVVSKYIGETEKNLRRVFDAAEATGAMLLFDEADALFGKRSDVKDSHDRFANIEVSYLLQRMEAYSGLAILTSNMRSALDKAFSRRLRFVIQFPFPDAAQREQIWRRIFPKATPTTNLDFSKLSKLNVAGGTARNIAINAAFIAAREGLPVSMRHLAFAARAELGKSDKAPSEADIRGWN